MSKLKQVTVYTDGACIGNPGPGGYGVILIYGELRKELSGGYRLTTNNRMELMAAIKGLSALKEPCQVILFSDSEYLVKAINKGWVKRWKENDWHRSNKKQAVNSDLWAELLRLCDKHRIIFEWVRGHNGHLENERCDKLAFLAAQQSDLIEDHGYKQSGSD